MSWYGEHVLPRVINVVMNTKQSREIRARVCSGLSGEVVEIGFGTGHNLPFVPSQVSVLRAVEPSQRSVALAGGRVAAAPFPVEIVGIDGQRIPLDDDTADHVLCTWSLCTIPDPGAAVAEMHRILRPGGALHFVEHGRSPEDKVRRWQDRLNGLQQRMAGGCNLNRDISGLIESGGFRIDRLDNFYVKGEPKPIGYIYEGVAQAR